VYSTPVPVPVYVRSESCVGPRPDHVWEGRRSQRILKSNQYTYSNQKSVHCTVYVSTYKALKRKSGRVPYRVESAVRRCQGDTNTPPPRHDSFSPRPSRPVRLSALHRLPPNYSFQVPLPLEESPGILSERRMPLPPPPLNLASTRIRSQSDVESSPRM
jgi:hypothetical protein